MTHWMVDIEIIPEDAGRMTYAQARLRNGSLGSGTSLEAAGHARRNPFDEPRPDLGAELAATRALAALVRKMQAQAAEDVNALTTPAAHGSAW